MDYFHRQKWFFLTRKNTRFCTLCWKLFCLEGILEVIGGIFNTLKSKKMALLSMPNDTSKLLFWKTYLCVCWFVCLINTRNNSRITTKVIQVTQIWKKTSWKLLIFSGSIWDYIMDTVDLYSNQLLPMPHPHGSVAPPSHHSPLPPLSSALTVPNSSSSQGKKSTS